MRTRYMDWTLSHLEWWYKCYRVSCSVLHTDNVNSCAYSSHSRLKQRTVRAQCMFNFASIDTTHLAMIALCLLWIWQLCDALQIVDEMLQISFSWEIRVGGAMFKFSRFSLLVRYNSKGQTLTEWHVTFGQTWEHIPENASNFSLPKQRHF